MRRYFMNFMIMTFMTIFLVGCNSTANAIVDYNNEFLVEEYSDALDIFFKTADEFDHLLISGELDDELHEMYLQEQLIPQAKELVQLVQDVNTENEVVKELHQLLIVAEENRLRALELEYEYLQDLDNEEIIEEADKIIKQAERKMDEFIERLEELKDKYDIEDDD